MKLNTKISSKRRCFKQTLTTELKCRFVGSKWAPPLYNDVQFSKMARLAKNG